MTVRVIYLLIGDLYDKNCFKVLLSYWLTYVYFIW